MCIDVLNIPHNLRTNTSQIYVTICDVRQHILLSNSAEEGLINYSIVKTLNFLYFKYIHSVYPSAYIARVRLHYITLHMQYAIYTTNLNNI